MIDTSKGLSMNANTTAAVVAAVAAVAASSAALVSLPFTARAANAARRQTELQRGVAEQANQPYVWADIRLNEAQGSILNFVIGNSGPTIATDVVVTVDPPLPLATLDPEATGRAFDRLRDGFKTLGPGRVVAWSLGVVPKILSEDKSQPFTITVDGQGPHGPLPTPHIRNRPAGLSRIKRLARRVTPSTHKGSERDRKEALTRHCVGGLD